MVPKSPEAGGPRRVRRRRGWRRGVLLAKPGGEVTEVEKGDVRPGQRYKTARSKGYHTKTQFDGRQRSGRIKSEKATSSSSKESRGGTTRSRLPGYGELSQLAYGKIYESKESNYNEEENHIFKSEL